MNTLEYRKSYNTLKAGGTISGMKNTTQPQTRDLAMYRRLAQRRSITRSMQLSTRFPATPFFVTEVLAIIKTLTGDHTS